MGLPGEDVNVSGYVCSKQCFCVVAMSQNRIKYPYQSEVCTNTPVQSTAKSNGRTPSSSSKIPVYRTASNRICRKERRNFVKLRIFYPQNLATN